MGWMELIFFGVNNRATLVETAIRACMMRASGFTAFGAGRQVRRGSFLMGSPLVAL
jgi:hypothetical protein